MNNETANKIHPRVYAIGLIVIWIRFMRSVRSFQSVGPFIVILGSVINDTIKFTFLFFEFYIPYTVAFWILFGGKENAGGWYFLIVKTTKRENNPNSEYICLLEDFFSPGEL